MNPLATLIQRLHLNPDQRATAARERNADHAAEIIQRDPRPDRLLETVEWDALERHHRELGALLTTMSQTEPYQALPWLSPDERKAIRSE